MSNVNKPQGLTPWQYLNGAPWNAGGRVYCIPDTDDTNAFAIGDPVVLDGGSDGAGVPTITLATAGTGNPVLGAIVSGAGALSYGSSYGVPAESPIVIPATKTRNYYVLVADDPSIIFLAQEEATGTAFTAAEVGLNANLVAGANNGYISGWQIDRTSPGTGSTLQVKLMRLAQMPGGTNTFGDYAKWLVLINNHVFKAGVTGI